MTSTSISARDEIDRLWDRSLERGVVRLMPGDFFVSRDEEVLTTVLGSCVSACIRDTESGVGGMNHFMLPDSEISGTIDKALAGRYGTHAMRFLIDGILRLGGNADNFEVKIFGGGRIVEGMSDVGERNIDFVRRYLHDAGLAIDAEDLGLQFPRKINYFVKTGRVMVKKLRAIHSRSILAEEQQFRQGIAGS